MKENLIIKVISISLIIVLGMILTPSINYKYYTKNPLKKVTDFEERIFKSSLEEKKYAKLKQALAIKKARDLKLAELKTAKSLSDTDLAILLYLVGFEGKKLQAAWAVAKKESNGRPLAYNGNTKTGDSSYGIFQINMIGNLGPERRSKYKLSHNKELFNPVTNASIAFKMTSGGDNWSAWKGMTPRTKQWLAKFPTVNLKQYTVPDLSALKV
jgi:hypothetical protein